MKILFFVMALVFSLMAAININTASKEELMQAKGIGEKKAEAIIEYRKTHGSFTSVDELTQVKGLGEKSVAALKSELSVD